MFITTLLRIFMLQLTSCQGKTEVPRSGEIPDIILKDTRQWYNYKKNAVALDLLLSSVELMVGSAESKEKFYFKSEHEINSSFCNEKKLWSKIFCQHVKENSSKRIISPFQNYSFCIYFDDSKAHNIKIRTVITNVNMNHVALLLSGCILFFAAKSLSRSTVFHYSSGMTLGVMMSWMIILIVLYRVLPFRKTMTTFLVAGTAGGFYFLEYFTARIWYLVAKYPYELAGTTLVFGIFCMALIYYFGPPTNERSLNLLQWFLQASALYMVYQSSYCKEFSVTVMLTLILLQFISLYSIVVTLVIRIIPRKVVLWFQRPKVRRLLTKRQYDEEGVHETEKALRELKKYCSSPDCNQWKVVSRLKNPRKFASFLTEGEQFTNDEIEAYDNFDGEEEEIRSLLDDTVESNDLQQQHVHREAAGTSGWSRQPESGQPLPGDVSLHDQADWLSDDETRSILVSDDSS